MQTADVDRARMSQFDLGRPLPPWHLEGVGGAPVPFLADFADRPLLVLFFHLGCPGCRYRAVPFANRVVVERGDAVHVVGIHTTPEGPDYGDDEIAHALDALHVRFPVYRDAGLAATYHAYRAGGTPHWVLADRGGTVLASIFGSDPNRALLRLDYHLTELEGRAVVGFGGGCHWCTEAVFQTLRGVDRVDQGWIRSEAPHDAWSEAVLVHFRPAEIDLRALIDVHLLTHASTSAHRLRAKYRSAVYAFGSAQREASERALAALRKENDADYVTQVLPFSGFRLNEEAYLDYYRTRPDAPFCQTYIHPKLQMLRRSHGAFLKAEPGTPRRTPPSIPRPSADAPLSQPTSPTPMLTWNDVIAFANHGNPTPPRRVEKTDDAWRALLSDEAYRVTRQHGTERPYSSEMCSLFELGRYACVCCGTLLFDAGEKFESGTGWPSFTQPTAEDRVAYHKDTSLGMVRMEVTCNVCDAHLGHVFPDGPAPSGLRYCINAVALAKVDADALETPTEADASA